MTGNTQSSAVSVFSDWLRRTLREPQVWGFFLSLAVIVILSLAFFAPDNIEGNSLSQPDMQQGQANGHEAQAYEQQTGEKALWTNSLFSGMPTFQISPSYPSNSLFTWIDSLYGMFLPSPSNLLCMMMLGFLILMYCMGMRWYYALIGAVAWGFSTYFIIIIGAGHIWKFVTLSYIPPTIGGLVLCYRGRWMLGGALSALFGMMQFNANHPQMSYYFAFVMAGLAIAYLCEAVKRKQLKRWCTGSAALVVAMALAVCANLPSLYNSYEYAKETQRASSEVITPDTGADGAVAERPTGGMPRSQIVGWSYGRSEMFSLLIPNVKGGATSKPEKGKMQTMSLDKISETPVNQDVQYYLSLLFFSQLSEKDKDFIRQELYNFSLQHPQEFDNACLGFFSQYFNDSEGTNGPVYVGALVFALFLLGCFIVKGPVKWALLALTLLSILLALGRNFESLTDLMIYNFPMYSKFRAVESILVIAEFTIPLLAVLGLVEFVRRVSGDTDATKPKAATAGKQSLWAVYASFGICVFICLLGLVAPSVFGEAITTQDRALLSQMYEYGYNSMSVQSAVESLRYGMVRDDSLRSLLFLLLGGAALWAYARGLMKRAVTIAVVGTVVLIDLYSVNKRYVDHDSFRPVNAYTEAALYDIRPDAIDNAILQDRDPHYRVMDYAGFSDPRRSYFHKMVGGYHAAKLRRYDDLITSGKIAQENVIDMLNAKYIIYPDEQGQLSYQPNPYALGNAWLVDGIRYVDDARAEFAALDDLDPATEAVADRAFLSVLGDDVVARVPGDTIYLTSYTPNTLTYQVDTRSGGLGVFSEVYFPWGWKATIDGQPAQLGRVNYILRALRIPAGHHQVVMTFDPDSIHTTSTIAYICVTLIYLWLIGALGMGLILKRKDGVV